MVDSWYVHTLTALFIFLEKNTTVVKNPQCRRRKIQGDTGCIPRLGGFPGGENGNLLQYSCLENSIVREAWQATICMCMTGCFSHV